MEEAAGNGGGRSARPRHGAARAAIAETRTTVWIAVLLGAAIAASYANALHVGFYFDDWHVLEKNPHIRSLASIPRFFVDPDATTVLRENKDLRPLLLTTFALNYAISGLETWSYHLVNLVLHWLATLLVFRIVRDHLWLGAHATSVAAAASLLVAVHPLNTEPVNYLSARSALLTAVCYLGAFDAALRRRRVTAALLFAGALLTKAIAVTLPLALAAYRLVERRRTAAATTAVGRHGSGTATGFLLVLVAIAGASVGYRLLLLPPWTLAATHHPSVTPWRYFMTEWSAYLYYLRLFLWPDALVVDRLDYPVVQAFTDPQAWGSLLALAILGGLAWAARRHRPALTFAALWFAVSLAAESTFFPLAEPVNEHRPYLAMLGLGTAAALALREGAGALARRRHLPPTWVFAVVVTLVASLLGAATHLRNRVWHDDYTLWIDATVKAPRNPRAWLNAGHAAMSRGTYGEARRLLMEAHRLSPCYAYVQLNLSALEARTGDPVASLRWADEGVACNPGFALARFHRASALERLGRLDDALAEYRRTTAIDASHFESWLAAGRLLERREAWREAAAAYEGARRADPTHVEAAMLAGLLHHYRLGDPARAVECYRQALAWNPGHYGAHYQIAVALHASGRRDEAITAWRRFVPFAEAIDDRDSLAAAPEALRLAHR